MRSLRVGIVWVVVGLTAVTVLADGYRNPPASASVLGRGGVMVAQVEDASAAVINPANMVAFSEASAMASVSFSYGKREFTGLDGVLQKTDDPWSTLPAVFAVAPFSDGKYVAGLGLTVPFGRSTRWDRDAIFSSTTPYFSELYVGNLNPSVATRISEDLSVGAGVSLYWSELEFKQVLPWSMLAGGAPIPDGTGRSCGDGTGFGANLAVTWTPADGHVLALTYRSGFKIDYEGDFKADGMPPPAAAMGLSPSSDFETEIKYPSVVTVGYGLQANERLRIEVDVEWIEASRNDEMTVDLGPNSILLPMTTIPQDWDDNWSFGVGADWRINEKLVARAGYLFLESPIPSTTMMPVASEDDQSVLSVGLGYARDGHTIDLAYLVGLFDGRTVSDNQNPTANGEYDFESHILSLAYAYTF